MANTKIDQVDTIGITSTSYSDMKQSEDSTVFNDVFSVPASDTDSPSAMHETNYQVLFSKWHAYYKEIPEFAAVVDKLASWTVGRGFEASAATKKQIRRIRGWGKDDFNSLLENQLKVSLIAGDSFAEIIRDKAGRVINLKPLNPGTISIVVDKKGIIKRYEQTSNVGTQPPIKFKPKDIFHLAYNRTADEIHGKPFGERVEWLIKMRNEAMRDMKTVFHRYVVPIQIIPVDSDDEAELSTFKAKFKNAYKKAEPILIPKDTVQSDQIKNISIPQFSTLDPLPWLKYLVRVFTTAAGVPEVIMGWGEETTEASSKIIYLAFQQTIERLQRFLESQLELQTGIKIDLEFPASIEPTDQPVKSISSDNQKDAPLNKEGVNPGKDQK